LISWFLVFYIEVMGSNPVIKNFLYWHIQFFFSNISLQFFLQTLVENSSITTAQSTKNSTTYLLILYSFQFIQHTFYDFADFLPLFFFFLQFFQHECEKCSKNVGDETEWRCWRVDKGFSRRLFWNLPKNKFFHDEWWDYQIQPNKIVAKKNSLKLLNGERNTINNWNIVTCTQSVQEIYGIFLLTPPSTAPYLVSLYVFFPARNFLIFSDDQTYLLGFIWETH
jgi:hypothetical protein